MRNVRCVIESSRNLMCLPLEEQKILRKKNNVKKYRKNVQC